MSYETRAVDLFLRNNQAFNLDESQEVHISFLLQNARPDDPRLIPLLIELYGSEIYRLVQAILKLPPGEPAEKITSQVFSIAGTNLRGILGETTPKKWLFKIVLRFASQRPKKLKRFGRMNVQVDTPFAVGLVSNHPRSRLEALIWKEVDRLPDQQRFVFLLRFLFGLNLQEIAELLEIRYDQVESQLLTARSRLLAVFPPVKRMYFNLHPERFQKIDDYLSGQLDQEEAIQSGLVQHVAECEHCFAYLEELVEFRDGLENALNHRWPTGPLGQDVQGRMEETAHSFASRQQHNWYQAFPWRQTVWTAGLILALAGIGWYFYPSEMDQELLVSNIANKPAAQEVSGTTRLPEPVVINTVNISEISQEIGDGSNPYIYHFEPALSGDGSWLAFSSTGKFLQEPNPLEGLEVYLYDRSSDQFMRGAPPMEEGNFRWQRSSSISGDGRWVAYTSNEQVETGQGVSDQAIMGVFVYDRETGQNERIDVPAGESPSNGDSFSPVISPDGRWVVYWSTSSNLIPGDQQSCIPSRPGSTCADVFVYDRENKNTTRIPVGRQEPNLYISDRLDISEDGRWIPLTLYRNDQIASEVGVINPTGIYLYDLQTGSFNRVDLSSEGFSGDHVAFSVDLSSDGRFAAFISLASNLVPGEDPPGADVFVRDLSTGVTERVTGRGDGILGSEVPEPFFGGVAWGYTVNLSADGRFISFLGRWDTSTGAEMGGCTSSWEVSDCNAVFVLDRESNRIEQVSSISADGIFLFPSLSEDGRWVSYLQMITNCDPSVGRPTCTEIWVYDRENDWTYPVTKGRYLLPEMTQLPAVSLETGGSPVMSLAFSPEGGTLATATWSDTIRLWGSESGGIQGVVDSSSGARTTSLAFSPDGDFLAAGLADGRVDLWRLPDRFNQYTLDGHPGEIQQVSFFDDGRLVVRTAKAIWFWQLREGIFVRTNLWEYTSGTVLSMSISPHEDLLATVERDGLVWIREASSGNVLLRLKGGGNGLRKVAFSQDGKYLAVLRRRGLVDVWKIDPAEDGTVDAVYVRTLSHPREISNLAFAPGGAYLATVSGAGQFRIWNVISGFSFRPFYPNVGLNSVLSFSQDRMAAGILSGLEQNEVYLVYLWKGLSSQAEPSFFQQGETDGDLPAGSLPAYRVREPGQGYTYIGKEVLFYSLYQASRAVAYEIKTPRYLPPGFQFRVAQVFPTGAVSLHYDYFENPVEPPVASLIILQHPDEPGFPGETVGASALIQEVEIGGLPGEYVRGEWQSFTLGSTGQGQFAWHWDSQSTSQRLRWKDGEQLYAIHYRPLIAEEIEGRTIAQSDLMDIAENMTPLEQPNSPDHLLAASISRDEQDCLVSARYSGRPVESIPRARQNQPGDCLAIIADQRISGHRIAFAEVDLNCDGEEERLEIQVLSGDPLTPPSFRVMLLEPAFTGRYQPAWSTQIPDSGEDLRAQAEVIRVEGCERYLSLEVTNEGQTIVQLFRWNGKEMSLVNEGGQAGLFEYGHDSLPPAQNPF